MSLPTLAFRIYSNDWRARAKLRNYRDGKRRRLIGRERLDGGGSVCLAVAHKEGAGKYREIEK